MYNHRQLTVLPDCDSDTQNLGKTFGKNPYISVFVK